MEIKSTRVFGLIEFYSDGEYICKCVSATGYNNHYTLKKGNNILAIMKPKYKFPLKFYTEIIMNNESVELISFGNFFKSCYYCVHKNERYEVFLHRNPHISIFKNNVQVASIKSKYIYKIKNGINSEFLYKKNEVNPFNGNFV